VVNPPVTSGPTDVAAAYAWCERLAREHYENFPVASRLLPARMRPHIAAIYAFARIADDFADEPGIPDEERLHLLDAREARLAHPATLKPAAATRAVSTPSAPGRHPTHGEAHQVFLALHDTIARCNLPVELLRDLLSAFRQDVTVKRYQNWNAVLDYCRRSANPVGRLVLRVAGYDDRKLDAASDALCTALQLTNFWQDLERDWANGRLYVPADERARGEADERDLDARRMTPGWQAALGAAAARTRALFAAGRPVCDGVGGRLRWELRLTWLGGSRILDKLEQTGFDVFRHRPTLGPADVPPLAWQALTWR
jgi:squalene synthase HpnC